MHSKTFSLLLICSRFFYLICFFVGPLNQTILILFGIYAAGGIAAFFRSWLYTLAGQRLVARLRKKVNRIKSLP